uniref:Transcription factor A, mitochondrial n=2 Tax=Jaculus jaculus TaxID=51337 RepID=A0A8C5KQJ3_JACJA
MALLWGALRALGGRRAELCAGCGSLLPSPLSFICGPKWFSSFIGNCPKKPMTKYIRFFRDQLSKCRAQNPEAKNLDIVKEIGRRWKELPESEKKAYEAAYKADWVVYKEELDRFNKALTPSQKEALKKEVLQKRLRRSALAKKRELTVLGKPKRARSAYNIYMSEKFQEASGETLQEKMKSVYEMWKILPSSQKQVYVQLANDDRIRYANEIRSWEKQMAEVGRSDLLRSQKKKRDGTEDY